MRKNKLLIAGITLMALISALVYSMTQPPAAQVSLVAQSIRLKSLPKDFNVMGYQWHPDGRLVTERWKQGGLREIIAVDTKSGTEQSLFQFAVRGNGYGCDDAGLLSPDGRWRISTLQKQFLLNSLDGKPQIVVPNTTNRFPCNIVYERTVAWMPGSKEWVELASVNGQNVLLIRGINSSAPRRVHVGAITRQQSLLGVDSDGNAIVAVFTYIKGWELLSIPLNGSGGKITRTSVSPPPGVLLGSPGLSPDGKYIVWTALWSDKGARAEFAKLFRSISGRRALRTLGLWLSKADGTGW